MQQPRMSVLDEKSQFIPASAKEYIDKLKKENVALMKLLADRNKIIELSGNQLHELRVTVQKLRQQNLQLAQSNSQMLAELTVDKDRLKLLHHELGCKNGLLVAKGLELKAIDETLPSQKDDKEVKIHNEKLDSSQTSRDEVKPININRRQLSKSLGPSTTVKESKDKKDDNKRQCVRRQSARLNSQESEPADDVSEVERNSLAFGSPHSDGMEEDFSKPSTVVINEERISGNKRIPRRRQSARLKTEEPEPAKDVFAVDSIGTVSGPNCDNQMQDGVSSSICLSAEENNKATGKRRLPARRQSARVKIEEPEPDKALSEINTSDNQMQDDVSSSVGLSAEENNKATGKRRRQSARAKSEEPEPDKALSEINTSDYKKNDISASAHLSNEKDSIEGKDAPNCESEDFGRPSLGRPSRQAAKKVNSYKEVPVNVKMRRSE